MNAWVLALLPAVVGVDYGWERNPDGSIVYIIQVDPEAVASMQTGAELVGALPPELRNITNYKIRLGRDRLPNQNQLPPEVSNRTVIPPPSAFPAPTGSLPLGGAQPAGGFPATSNYQTQPGYTQPSYTTPTNPLAASAGGQPTSTGGFPMAGSNPGGYGTPGSGTAAGGTGWVNTNPAYNGQPNNPAAPLYQPGQPQTTGTQGYVWDPVTRTYTLASPTLPTGVVAPTGTTSPSAWPANGVAGTQPTYGPAGGQPGYQQPPALPGTASWASNPSGGYGQPTATGVTGPAFGPPPDYSVNRLPAEGAQQPGFTNSNATPAGAGMASPVSQNRPTEPTSPHSNAAANNPAPSQEKSWGLPVALVLLFASVGFNMWCGWTTYNLRERYRSLLSERAPAY